MPSIAARDPRTWELILTAVSSFKESPAHAALAEYLAAECSLSTRWLDSPDHVPDARATAVFYALGQRSTYPRAIMALDELRKMAIEEIERVGGGR